MYLPPAFREDRLDIQHAFIRANSFGTLVTMGADGLTANHIPFVIDTDASSHGTLRGHLSRANPQWQSLDASQDALVIFQGPESYITPSWYATKAETGKVVPTWNFTAVHVWGRPRVIEDTDWLARQIDGLTAMHESGRARPWSVSDAPADFVVAQMKGIVGIEIEIVRIEGKWKVSQNRPQADRDGVVRGLSAAGDENSRAMAQLVAAGGATPKPAR